MIMISEAARMIIIIIIIAPNLWAQKKVLHFSSLLAGGKEPRILHHENQISLSGPQNSSG